MAIAKEQHYKNLPIQRRVQILDVDVSRYTTNVAPITSKLDTQVVGEFTINKTTLTLRDDTGLFALGNPNNFFVQNGGNQTGYLASVKVYLDFVEGDTLHTELLIDGEIIDVNNDIKPDSVVIQVSDQSQPIRNKEVSDLGLTKHLTIPVENGNEFPIAETIAPISTDSDTARAFLNPGDTQLTTLTRVENIRSEGVQNPSRYEVHDDAIEVEGEPTYTQMQLEGKFPFRHKKIETLIKELLDAYNINDRDIDITDSDADLVVEKHISSNGRVAYDNDSELPDLMGNWAFEGVVTDFVYNTNTQKFYFLYSARDRTTRPKIIEYDVATDTFTTLYKHNVHNEWWRFATTDFDTFYILATTTSFTDGIPDRGVYDSSEETDSNPYIGQYVHSTTTYSTLRDHNDNARPQIAMYLHTGSPDDTPFSLHESQVPDSRRNMQVTGTTLYYPYATGTAFGVARGNGIVAATAVADGQGNTSGFDFAINGNTLYLASTSINPSTSESTLYVHSYTI